MASLDKSSSGESAASDPKNPQQNTLYGVREDVARKFLEKGKQQRELEAKNKAFGLEQQKKMWEAVKIAGRKTRRRGKKVKKATRKTKSRRAH